MYISEVWTSACTFYNGLSKKDIIILLSNFRRHVHRLNINFLSTCQQDTEAFGISSIENLMFSNVFVLFLSLLCKLQQTLNSTMTK